MTCSPSATALALDDFPDDGLFFRTVPSDSVQAGAIARAIDLTGRSSVAVLYVDDAYGLPLTNSLTAELDGRAVSVEELVPLHLDDADYSDEARAGARLRCAGDRSHRRRDRRSTDRRSPPRGVGRRRTIPIIVNDAIARDRHSAPSSLGAVGRPPSRVRGIGLHAVEQQHRVQGCVRERVPELERLPRRPTPNECVDLIVLAASEARVDRRRLRSPSEIVERRGERPACVDLRRTASAGAGRRAATSTTTARRASSSCRSAEVSRSEVSTTCSARHGRTARHVRSARPAGAASDAPVSVPL